MALRTKNLKDQEFKEPKVVFSLKQYETLIDYIEEMEDRITVLERLNEPTIPYEEVEENFKKKFGTP
jgi:hypothetical protein